MKGSLPIFDKKPNIQNGQKNEENGANIVKYEYTEMVWKPFSFIWKTLHGWKLLVKLKVNH